MDIIFTTVQSELVWLKEQPLETILDYRFAATPDSETIREAAERFKRALREIAARHEEGGEVVVITHSALMGSMLIAMDKMAPEFDRNPFGSASIPNLGMMKFEVTGDEVVYLDWEFQLPPDMKGYRPAHVGRPFLLWFDDA